MKRVALLVVLASGSALADNAVLTWVNPTTYADGTVLDKAIAQTTLQCSAVVLSGARGACALASVFVLGSGTSYTWSYTAPAGSYSICFQAKTVLIDAAESDWSAESCKTVTVKKPGGPKLAVK